MTSLDAFGYFAASLVLATFCARSMVTLRLLGITSNIAFMTYAGMAHLWPILLLHAVMLPLNLQRLRDCLSMPSPQCLAASRRAGTAIVGSRPSSPGGPSIPGIERRCSAAESRSSFEQGLGA
jgi:hypothetical protein